MCVSRAAAWSKRHASTIHLADRVDQRGGVRQPDRCVLSRRRTVLAALALLGGGCDQANLGPVNAATSPPAAPSAAASVADAQESVVMPTPSSVTMDEPGGDAPDKELAALTRLVEAKEVGKRGDKWGTLKIGQIDPNHWKRATIFGTPTRVTFTYGDSSHAVSAVVYEPSEGPSDPRACLAKFLRFANDMATTYDIEYQVSPVYDREQVIDGQKKPMAEVLVEGHVNYAFMANDYVAGIVAYDSFPGTCLVQSFAAVSTRHPAAARKARDVWINQAAPLLLWNSVTVKDKAPGFDAL